MSFLSCIYRACNREVLPGAKRKGARPPYFDKRKCWKSFYQEFGRDAQIFVVFDGTPDEELSQYICRFKIQDIIYSRHTGRRQNVRALNQASLKACYKLAEKLDSDALYFAEDDYLYAPKAFEIMVEGLRTFDGTVSLYHHPDRFRNVGDLTKGRDFIYATKSCYWATREYNTCTFGLKKGLFLKIKNQLFNFGLRDIQLFRHLFRAYGLRHFNPISNTFGATHVHRPFLSLYINWRRINGGITV